MFYAFPQSFIFCYFGEIMKRTVAIVLVWVLVIGWMGLIFSMSAQNADTSTDTSGKTIRLLCEVLYPEYKTLAKQQQEEIISRYQGIVRKLAHFSIYSILGALIAIAICLSTQLSLYRIGSSWLIAAAYAASDEIHQYFVPGRSCEARDVFIDSCGALVGILFVFLIFRLKEKHNEKKRLASATF